MHPGLWGMHNAFVGDIKNIICCSCPQEFAAVWEDMIYTHEMLNKDSRFEWQYGNINHMSNKYRKLLVERSVQTEWSEKNFVNFYSCGTHSARTLSGFIRLSYLMMPCLFIFSNVP